MRAEAPQTASPSPPVAPLPASASSAAPVAPAAAAAEGEDSSRPGFGWLKRGAPQPKVPPVRDLLASEGPDQALVRAVASELTVDAPDGCFEDLPGLTNVPPSVPKAMRVTLLHTAVKSEAEKLKAVERTNAVVRVAGSMLTELADRAADLAEKSEQTEALENLVALAREATQLCAELAPDVEPALLRYGGAMRPKDIEALYMVYVDASVQEVQAQTAAMLGAFWGGGGGAPGGNAEQMQARVEQNDLLRKELAAFLKIPESKADKLMEERVEAIAQEAQQEMMKGLASMGGS